MNEDRIFAINNISLLNLDAISENQVKSIEMRNCELAFIVDEILKTSFELLEDGMNVYEILMLLSEELFFDDLSKKNRAFKSSICDVSTFLSSISHFDMASFSELLVSKFKEKGASIEENTFLAESDIPETFTYVKNSLSDEAYDVFSVQFSDPRVTYSDNFKKACFDVADGKVGYCIMPFEEKGGMRIPSISSLISALDLKIVDVTPVFGFEGTADMKYALIGQSFRIPERNEDTDRYLEIRIGADSQVSLSAILSVAERFGISIYKIDTMSSYENGENSMSYSVVLKDGGKSFASFLVFMTLFSGAFTPVGIYKNLE